MRYAFKRHQNHELVKLQHDSCMSINATHVLYFSTIFEAWIIITKHGAMCYYFIKLGMRLKYYFKI